MEGDDGIMLACVLPEQAGPPHAEDPVVLAMLPGAAFPVAARGRKRVSHATSGEFLAWLVSEPDAAGDGTASSTDAQVVPGASVFALLRCRWYLLGPGDEPGGCASGEPRIVSLCVIPLDPRGRVDYIIESVRRLATLVPLPRGFDIRNGSVAASARIERLCSRVWFDDGVAVPAFCRGRSEPRRALKLPYGACAAIIAHAGARTRVLSVGLGTRGRASRLVLDCPTKSMLRSWFSFPWIWGLH